MTDLQSRVLELLSAGSISADTADVLLDHDDSVGYSAGVVVTGASVRLPGISTLDEMWDLLRSSSPLTRPFPSRRLELILGASDELAAKWTHLRDTLETDPQAQGGWLTDLEEFSPERYGLDDFEAMFLGPNERILLDLASEALEASCIDPASLKGSSTGVFLAHNPDSAFPYVRLFEDPDERAVLSGIPANVAYRVAYTYGLMGPVMNIDTTCSSSLAALHVARRSLQLGECDTAIVAGINLDLLPFDRPDSTGFALSSERSCKAYDNSADGTWWGEGAAAVILRRSDDAIRDSNPVFVELAGSAVTCDGRSNGMMAPNPTAHSKAVRAALSEAGVSGNDIGYVEGHGAGTILGDQVEVSALSDAFRVDSQERGYCSLGSVKTITGHLKDAAGIVGLLSAALRVRHRLLPPLARLKTPAASVSWSDSPFILDSCERTWDRPGPAVAGVSSLGLSGTNVHAIVRESVINREPSVAVAGASSLDTLESKDSPQYDCPPILLSAESRRSLFELVERLRRGLDNVTSLDAIAATFARRPVGTARVAIVPRSIDGLIFQLERLSEVRVFDRAPDTFPEQGIFLADTEHARKTSMAATGSVPDLTRDLVADFISGKDVALRYRERTAHARPLVLPVPPPTTRRIWPAQSSAATDVSDIFFSLDWVAATDSSGTTRFRDVVVVAPDDSSAVAVSSALAERGDQVRYIIDSETTSQENDIFRGPVRRVETFRDVWKRIGAERLSRLDAVVFVGDLAGNQQMDSLESVRSSQEMGAIGLFAFAQSAVDLPSDHAITIAAVALEVHNISGNEQRQRPTQATTFGLLRVISQEMPQFVELCVDVGSSDLERVDELLAAELTRPADLRPRQVAYRDGQRLRRVLERSPQPLGLNPSLRVEPGSVHVIAGGTGNLGPVLAEFLADQGAGTIVLLSRNPLPDLDQREALRVDPEWGPRLGALERAEATGCRVVHLVCDLTDPDAVDRAFRELDSEGLSPDGGYMLSKQLYHQWIRDLTEEEFRAGLDNRLAGTWLFAEALRVRNAEHLVLFSSVSSMSGTKGAAECASVNQYLDAAAPWLSATGLSTYTVNWSLILEDRAYYKARTPIPPIDFRDFREALRRVFSFPSGLDVVARIDLREADYLRPVLRIPLGDSMWDEVDEAVSNSTTRVTKQATASRLDRHSAQSPKMPPEEGITLAWESALGYVPDQDSHFFGSGGSSLSVIRFVHQIAKHLGEGVLDVSDIYATPTLGQLVETARRTLYSPETQLSDRESLATDDDTGELNSLLRLVEEGQLSPSDAAQQFSAGSNT